MRWVTVSLTLLLISVLLSGCSLNKQSDSVQKAPIKADISVSLAHSYDTYDQLVSASNLIGVVKILDINHVDTNEGATYYNAKVLDPFKTSNKKVTDIIVKQLGIQK